MAEISNGSLQKSSGKRSARRKLTTRVDLTPMVDLGFLLITFFIFTTSMSEPKTMKIRMPADAANNPSVTAENKTLTILPAADNRVFYYEGNDIAHAKLSDYSDGGIRSVIISERRRVAALSGDAHELVVLIKPLRLSNYENVVRLFDEMLINDVSRYMLTEPSEAEVALMN